MLHAQNNLVNFTYDTNFAYVKFFKYVYPYIIQHESANGRNNSIFRFSFFNIHVIQNPKGSSM